MALQRSQILRSWCPEHMDPETGGGKALMHLCSPYHASKYFGTRHALAFVKFGKSQPMSKTMPGI
jgi:hypothetical protein